MAIAQCIIRSQTLNPGEPFILPPGATIIGTTNVDNIDSTCVDLSDLETLTCYCFQILFTEENGGTTPVFKDDNVTIYGLYVSSTQTLYPFTSNIEGVFAINLGIQDAMEGTDIGPIIMDTCITYDSDTSGVGASDRGQVLTVCIKTIPSIGNSLMLKASTSALIDPDFEGYYYIPAIPYADVTSNKCGCTPLT